MRSTFGLLLLFASLHFLSGCNDTDEKIIYRFYKSDSEASIYLDMQVYDSLELDIPNTIAGFDSVSVFFPTSNKEFPCSRIDSSSSYSSKYYFQVKQIIPVFNRNDSIQVVFKKKNQVVFRPTLYKFTDTIFSGGGGMIKFC